MKVKRLLKFYFRAEGIDRAIDGVIMKHACSHAAGVEPAERICGLIGEKIELGKLWSYLNEVIPSLPPGDVDALKRYAAFRGRAECCGGRREIRRAVAKFTRRARRLSDFCEGIGLVGKYYCLL